jgi:hypothetical protein
MRFVKYEGDFCQIIKVLDGHCNLTTLEGNYCNFIPLASMSQ